MVEQLQFLLQSQPLCPELVHLSSAHLHHGLQAVHLLLQSGELGRGALPHGALLLLVQLLRQPSQPLFQLPALLSMLAPQLRLLPRPPRRELCRGLPALVSLFDPLGLSFDSQLGHGSLVVLPDLLQLLLPLPGGQLQLFFQQELGLMLRLFELLPSLPDLPRSGRGLASLLVSLGLRCLNLHITG